MKATKKNLPTLTLAVTPKGDCWWTDYSSTAVTYPFPNRDEAAEWAIASGYSLEDGVELPKPNKSPDLDDLAAMAMQGLCAWQGYHGMAESIARDAYEIARAMLKEREK